MYVNIGILSSAEIFVTRSAKYVYTAQGQLVKSRYNFFIQMFFRVQVCMSGSRLKNLLAIFYENSSTGTTRIVLSVLIVSSKAEHGTYFSISHNWLLWTVETIKLKPGFHVVVTVLSTSPNMLSIPPNAILTHVNTVLTTLPASQSL